MEDRNILIMAFAFVVAGALGMLYGTPSYSGWNVGGPGMMSGWTGESESFRSVPSAPGSGMMWESQTTPSRYTSNGELLYYTGVDEDGYHIIPNGGPNWLYMHGGSCVDCHGRNGQGGIVPMMCAEETPAITYHALTEEEHEEHGEEGHMPYTDETIRIAITQGIEPDNETMDWCMPRWDISEKNLDAIIDYLKTMG